MLQLLRFENIYHCLTAKPILDLQMVRKIVPLAWLGYIHWFNLSGGALKAVAEMGNVVT